MSADVPQPGRVAGVDYGTVRIGIALSDPSRRWVSPHEVYTRGDEARDAEFFRQLVQQEDVTLLVVGLPVHLNGRESEKSGEARRFAHWLGEVTGAAVELFDERFTSAEADTLMAPRELTRRSRRQRRDAVAASVMLTAYLESGRRDDASRALDE